MKSLLRCLGIQLFALTGLGSSPIFGGGFPADPVACCGDCDGDNSVTVDEILKGINVALGSLAVESCSASDRNGDAEVTVDEIVCAVARALNGCPPRPTPTETSPPNATPTSTPSPMPTAATSNFCDLPGSVRTTVFGKVTVPGGPEVPSLNFIELPVGFCAHYFAHVGNARHMRFAPGGELFVASPTTATTSGGQGGQAAILVLPDDNHDGTADSAVPYLTGLPSTQGMLFSGEYFYYQDGTKILRRPYQAGDRAPSGASEELVDIQIYQSTLHWPKSLDVADDGTIFVGNGGDQGEPCNPARPFHGGILELDGSIGGKPVAKGFRNPISVRCPRGRNLCYAVELSRDYTNLLGGREKVSPIRRDEDWGFPCCATKDMPYPDVRPIPDCSGVIADVGSFTIGGTPFDIDYETGKWPFPWDHSAFIPLHGAYGNWAGARLVAIGMSPITGELLPSSDLRGAPTGAMSDFATGWGDGTRSHGRPTAVAFAPDGRLFLANDTNGDIIWIAPFDL